jgi:hypothetical protein
MRSDREDRDGLDTHLENQPVIFPGQEKDKNSRRRELMANTWKMIYT